MTQSIYVTQPALPPLQEFMPYLEEIWANKILTNGGPFHQQLEKALCDCLGVQHLALFSNGTLGLVTALQALRVTGEVITTPYSFVATAHSLLWNGIKPVFVDVHPDTLNLDPARIEAAITPHTKAIIPVSLYGQCADYDAINAIAARHGITVIEDAAQSFGATYKGRKSCNLTTIACTSFFPSKPLGCYGDGGAIFTSDDELAKVMRQIARHGQDRRYHHIRVGVNSRLDTLQAAILLPKLAILDEEMQQRQQVAQRYAQLISSLQEAEGNAATHHPAPSLRGAQQRSNPAAAVESGAAVDRHAALAMTEKAASDSHATLPLSPPAPSLRGAQQRSNPAAAVESGAAVDRHAALAMTETAASDSHATLPLTPPDPSLRGAAGDAAIQPPHIEGHNTSAWAQYTVQVPHRDQVQQHLKQAGIPTAVHYPIPLNQQPAVADPAARLPVGDAVAQRVMSLPMYPGLDAATQERIVRALLAATAA